ncbi:MAG: hypothetical protein GY870_05195 [archaeon]|nr:hypothetical protein [archaeon]
MRKFNHKITLLIVLSLIMIDSVFVFASKSLNDRGSILELDSIPSASAPYTLNIGAWIIVAGDRRSDHDLYYSIENGCNDVYYKLINMGFPAERIYYMAADIDDGSIQFPLPDIARNKSTRTNIAWAITQWAQQYVGPNNALGLYLFDHGGIDGMALPGPGYNLGDSDLNNQLNSLESSTGMTRSVIIYEACHSGSFIDPVSKPGRVIITATDITHGSAPNPGLTNAVFSEHFWAAVSMGYKLGYCFEYATWCVDIWGLSAVQIPWIDDNGNEIGHPTKFNGELPYGGDGEDALDISLGGPGPILSLNPVNFIKCKLPSFIPNISSEIPLWVVAENNSELEYIRARVFPWWWKWPEARSDENGSYFRESDFTGIKEFDLTLDPESSKNGEKNYTATLEVGRWLTLFNKSKNYMKGEYKIVYEAKAAGNGSLVAQPLATKVTMNEDGETPTDEILPTVTITNPSDDHVISNEINITVQGDDDQALDEIKILLDGVELNTTSMPSYLPYPEVEFNLDTTRYINGIHNITAIATDESGNEEQTSVFVNFQNNLILNFDYQPYLIGAALGVALSAVGQIIWKKKRK